MKSEQKNGSQLVLLYAGLVTPRQGQGQWKWFKMVEINKSTTMVDMKKMVEQFAFNVQCVTFARQDRQTDGEMAGGTNTTH